MMAILQNDKRIEQLETSAALTESNEFSFASNPNTYVPSGLVYHKIVTKSKEVIYQTKNKPEKSSQKIIREKNLTPLEIYRQAKNNNIKTSKYFKNKKVEPKEADYKKGYFDRYFLQLASDDKAPIIEVTKKEFDQADGMYKKQPVTWSLSKDKLEMEKMNEKSVLFAEKTFPQIRMKIYNFVEFGKES